MMYSRGLDDSGWTYRRRRISAWRAQTPTGSLFYFINIYNTFIYYNNYCKLLYQYSSMLSAPEDSLLLFVNTSLIWKKRCRGPAPLYGSKPPAGSLHLWHRRHA